SGPVSPRQAASRAERTAALLLPREFSYGPGPTQGLLAYINSYASIAEALDGLDVNRLDVSQSSDGSMTVTHEVTGRLADWLGGLSPTDEAFQFRITQSFDYDEAGVPLRVRIDTDLARLLPVTAPSRPKLRDAAGSLERLASFPPGSFPEGVVAMDDGDILVSMLFSNEIWRFGDEAGLELAFQLPFDAIPGRAGLFCLARDETGTIYANVVGGPEIHGVWRVDPSAGTAERIITVPPFVAMNGLTVGADGALYTVDTFGGAIWRADPASGAATVWFASPILRGRPFVGVYPGANGVQAQPDGLFVTVSDTALVLSISASDNGAPQGVKVISREVAGDDFAVDGEGALIVTTHPFNSLVELQTDGEQRLLAGVEDGMIGPVAAARYGDVVYVVTDGGLYAPVEGAPIEPSLFAYRLGAE
ncbi:MAG: hypothetical protein AAGL49_11975, partial [Pseudomonadota bacterium]